MPFRMRDDARKWFEDVPRDMDFDVYYFCLMAGLSSGRKSDATGAVTTDLVNDFPGLYRDKGYLIVAMFLSRELRDLGIGHSERVELHQAIRRLVNPLEATHLSDAGLKEMNRYAFGGFEYLREQFDERPRSLETFLLMYQQIIQTNGRPTYQE